MEKKTQNHTLVSDRSLRILQVINKMDRGGAEIWLMHILRNIDRERFHLDFLVHDPAPGALDAEIQSLGSRIICCPYSLKYPWQFKRILRDYGPYDIVHSQLHSGGFHLFLASQAGVPVRISHVHIDKFRRKLFSFEQIAGRVSHMLIKHYATGGLAISRTAAASRFGPSWEADPRWQVFYCSIDLNSFRENIDPQGVRRELGIPPEVLVIGHAGKFTHQKNHRFIIRIASELSRLLPDFRLLLVGDGRRRPEIEHLADQAGLRDKVIFAGLRADVPRLLRGAMDVFVFPSYYEGLPLALLEAQAAGLPCLISDTITAEAEVVKPLFQRLSLSDPASRWAEAVLAAREVQLPRAEALGIMAQSKFNVESSCRELVKFYLDQMNKAGVTNGRE